MKSTILITGANRGIGLEFVRQYAMDNGVVHACCRNPNEAKELQELQKSYPQIKIHKLDVNSQSDIEALQKSINEPIDILINNAVDPGNEPPFGQLSVERLTEAFLTNAVAPVKITEAFVSHLSKGNQKVVASISARLGSITHNIGGGYYSYRSSKAALNMLMKSVGVELEKHKIKVLLLHPGWVKTRIGGQGATLTAEDSVKGMRFVIKNYAPKPGDVIFYNHLGERVPW